MENVFVNGGLTIYGENWQVKGRRGFTDAEKGAVRSASVVDSKYGKSICFFMKTGGTMFIPMSNHGTQLGIGASVDMSKAELVTLGRTGDADILRVEIKG